MQTAFSPKSHMKYERTECYSSVYKGTTMRSPCEMGHSSLGHIHAVHCGRQGTENDPPNSTRMGHCNRQRECGTKLPLYCSTRTLAEEGALRKWEPTADYVCMWLSVKVQGKDYCVFFVVFFTGKRAFAEKSLHIWQGKLDMSQQYVLLKHICLSPV